MRRRRPRRPTTSLPRAVRRSGPFLGDLGMLTEGDSANVLDAAVRYPRDIVPLVPSVERRPGVLEIDASTIPEEPRRIPAWEQWITRSFRVVQLLKRRYELVGRPIVELVSRIVQGIEKALVAPGTGSALHR